VDIPRITAIPAEPSDRHILTSARIDPIAPASCFPAVVAGRDLWYLAQTGHGIVLDKIVPAP
jgi:hypothetical protein